MIAARFGLLLVSSLLMLAALGATDPDIRPSGQRLAVTAVIGLLAPVLWPGCAATSARTVVRIASWSAAAACMAAIVLQILGNPAQPFLSVLVSCMMLLLILLLTHALAAAFEWRLRGSSGDAKTARELAGRTVAIALAFLGSLPLWLGPAAELLSTRRAGIIDTVIGISPLTHLAVASDNDLLRNQWFYQQANLAALQFSYPGLAELALAYAAVFLMLALIALVFWRQRRVIADASSPCPTTEKTT